VKKEISLFLCVAVFGATSVPSLAQNKYILKAEQAMDQSPLFELFSRNASGGLALLDPAQDCDSFIPGSRCRLAGLDVPGVFSQPGVPEELIFVPGAQAVVVGFTAPTTGIYRRTASIRRVSPDVIDPASVVGFGEGIGTIASPNIDPVDFLLPAIQKVRASAFSLDAGQTYFLSFTSNGNPDNSRVGVSLSMAFVPEPAAWVMLIAGFGLTGATLRRRRALAAA
jgi:hypothetical protein